MARLTALVVALSLGGCTLVGIGTGAGITAIHNSTTGDEHDWHYGTPMLVGAGLGLLADLGLILLLGKQWSKPMT